VARGALGGVGGGGGAGSEAAAPPEQAWRAVPPAPAPQV